MYTGSIRIRVRRTGLRPGCDQWVQRATERLTGDARYSLQTKDECHSRSDLYVLPHLFGTLARRGVAVSCRGGVVPSI